ncbi:hypothetical protein MBAV_005402 [Candidatus Magnetobacterium bavaricum]|uniref:Uncharacterized protein n=1 Tax=Candidatus Magnetobacterium bavaricum TaxID=29290 RepID=A0A0F3GKC9_9BACT|nr:hypothetical protein MBAV_005402 [Candidatus Magnetobacterium bavaricum]
METTMLIISVVLSVINLSVLVFLIFLNFKNQKNNNKAFGDLYQQLSKNINDSVDNTADRVKQLLEKEILSDIKQENSEYYEKLLKAITDPIEELQERHKR